MLEGSNLIIKKDDTVAIKAQGRTVTGTVLSATNWGGRDGWYIELTGANVPGGYSYWKQGQDGGHLTEVNNKRVDIPNQIGGEMVRRMISNYSK